MYTQKSMVKPFEKDGLKEWRGEYGKKTTSDNKLR